MSGKSECPICFKEGGVVKNFGTNREAEKKFMNSKFCNCVYQSSEEMMLDQDMGFLDPQWIPISKLILETYHLRIWQGLIESPEEHVRFFLKLLKNTGEIFGYDVVLNKNDRPKGLNNILDGKPEKTPLSKIFEDQFTLKF